MAGVYGSLGVYNRLLVGIYVWVPVMCVSVWVSTRVCLSGCAWMSVSALSLEGGIGGHAFCT
jgi:hypothetical protein